MTSFERTDVLPPFFDRFMKHGLLSPEEEAAFARFSHAGRSAACVQVAVSNLRRSPRSCRTRKKSSSGAPVRTLLRIERPADRDTVYGIVHISVGIKDAYVSAVSDRGFGPVREGDLAIKVFRSGKKKPREILPLRHDRRWGWYVRWNTKTVPNGNYRIEAHVTDALALRATHALMGFNYRFVLSVARRFLWSGLPLEDLFNEGVVGLKTAVEKFDPCKGFRFNTYATWWVRQAITRHVRTTSRTIRIPNQQWDRHHAVRMALAKHGEDTPAETIAEFVSEKLKKDLTKDSVEETLAHFAVQVLPYDIPSDTDGGFSVLDVVPDEGPDQLGCIIEMQAAEKLRECLGVLSPRDREIISLRFGLGSDGEERTLQQIGEEFGISRERVRQIEEKALEKLAKAIDPRVR